MFLEVFFFARNEIYICFKHLFLASFQSANFFRVPPAITQPPYWIVRTYFFLENKTSMIHLKLSKESDNKTYKYGAETKLFKILQFR